MNIEMTSPTSLVEQFIQANLGDEKEIRSQLAIVIHGNNTGSRTCITRHKINDGKLSLGDVISIDDLAEAVTDMQSRNESNNLNAFEDFIEPHIIAQNSKILAWYTPRKKQTLFLTQSSFLVTLPPLLYIYKPVSSNGMASLSVFALACNKRPDTNTKLYHVPLPNIYESGKVCLGTMKIPQQMSDNIIDAVEKEFFCSKFTHPNHNHLTRKSVNIEAFYRQKEKSGKRILTSELMPTQFTVGQVLGGR
ncbi:PRTRC system protein B [Shewanella sp. SM96]|uniref:PRTRC system protein B n=1 Tax=Shewanella TaxID=22 RepID=UPI0021DA550D|nr:PRTRC system protein B [Shewanella sp. SM96]MCU8005387.1 PRTRC system protein B [Shewanella sp. SM96]